MHGKNETFLSLLTFHVLSFVRSLPGEPQCAGHPEAGRLRDRPHAPRLPGASQRVSKQRRDR